MSNKPSWPGFGGLLGRRGPTKGLTTVEQRCAAGLHAIDPTWTKCWYCEAAAGANQSTRYDPGPPDAASDPFDTVIQPEQSGRGSTAIGSAGAVPADANDLPGRTVFTPEQSSERGRTVVTPEPASGRGRTVVTPDALPGRGRTMVDSSPLDAPQAVRRAGGGRRIVGILTTYTWSRLGVLHPIYDGRNFVGAGGVGGTGEVGIVVSEDRLLSSSHFLVLCQGARIFCSDNLSTNGTFVDGEQIDARGVELHDDAVIRAGATTFRFQKIHAIDQPEDADQTIVGSRHP